MSSVLTEKVSDGFFKLKTYWKKPPKGYYVSYKEFVNLSLGFGISSFLSVMIGMATFDVAKDMMVHFNVSTGQVWLFGMISALIGILRAPIMSMCIDNCKSKRGKFKPFIMPATIITCVCYCITPFIPLAWNNNVLNSINIPAIPWLGLMEASNIIFTPAIISLWVLILVAVTASTFVSQAVAGIEQTITPVSQERSNIAALRGLICNIPASVANAVPGILLMFGVFKTETIGTSTIYPLVMNKILFPICSIFAIILVFFVVRGTHERVVLTNSVKERVKFKDGARALSTNKYFWIVVAYQIIITIRANINVVDVIRQYSYSDNQALAGVIDFFSKTLLMNAFVLGMVLGPILMKKFGKRKVMICSNIGFVIFAFLQLATYKVPILVVMCTFFQNIFVGFDYITGIMTSDALDYEQYRHGKRVEGFWQNFSGLITTITGVFVALIPLVIAALAGIGFGDKYAEKMLDPNIRDKFYLYRSIVGVISGALAAIPIFFYDMTEKQHSSIVKSLKIRAVKDDYAAGTLTDSQIVELKEIADYAKEFNDTFIQGKLSEFEKLGEVLAMFEDAKAREDEKYALEEKEEFERNIELENKKLENRIAKQKAASEKAKVEFDEQQFIHDYVYRNRYLINLEMYADIKAEKDADNEKVAQERFANHIAKEEGKYQVALEKARQKAVKGNVKLNEDDFREKFVYNSKYIIKQENFAEMFEKREKTNAEIAKEKTILEIEKVNKRLEKIKVKIA